MKLKMDTVQSKPAITLLVFHLLEALHLAVGRVVLRLSWASCASGFQRAA